MKFVCDRCQTHYYIGDQKVTRKILRIRCRICGNIIVVLDAHESSSSANTGAAEHHPRRATTPASSGSPEAAHPQSPCLERDTEHSGGHREWYVSIEAQRSGPFSRVEVARVIDAAGTNKNVYVWKAGMSAWKPPRLVLVVAHELNLLHLPMQPLPTEPCADTDKALEVAATPPPIQPLPPIGAQMPATVAPSPLALAVPPTESVAFPEIEFSESPLAAPSQRQARLNYLIAVLAIVGLAILIGLVILREKGARIEAFDNSNTLGSWLARHMGSPNDGNFAFDLASKHPRDTCSAPLPFPDLCAHCGTCMGESACVGGACGDCRTDADSYNQLVRKKGKRSEPAKTIC